MSSENTASKTSTKTPDDANRTQKLDPVSAPQGHAPVPAPQANAPVPAPQADVAAGKAPQGGGSVKDGAVKAAAAALEAARSAAKRVQSVASARSATSADAGSATSGTTAPETAADSGAATSAPEQPRPQMHYTAGGVRGTAQEVPPTTGAQQAAPGASASPQPAAADPAGGPRRVRLSVSRIDPWSIMKLAFLLSVAVGIMIVVAAIVVWQMLNSLGTFAAIQEFMNTTLGPQTADVVQFVEFDRMISMAVLIAIVNIVIWTALATITGLLYNITAALVGGVHLTLTDE